MLILVFVEGKKKPENETNETHRRLAGGQGDDDFDAGGALEDGDSLLGGSSDDSEGLRKRAKLQWRFRRNNGDRFRTRSVGFFLHT